MTSYLRKHISNLIIINFPISNDWINFSYHYFFVSRMSLSWRKFSKLYRSECMLYSFVWVYPILYLLLMIFLSYSFNLIGSEVIISPIWLKNISICFSNFCYIYVHDNVIFSFFGSRILISILSDNHHISTLIFRQKANHSILSLFRIIKLVILQILIELFYLYLYSFISNR